MHTLGPWQISYAPAGKKGTSISIWRNDEGPNPPADSGNTNWARICQHVHSKDDARLIASAPKLLQWLEVARDMLEQAKKTSEFTLGACKNLSCIDSVIAEAKGLIE